MNDARDEPAGPAHAQLGIRRWGDACFHAVEEEVSQGYIVDGILIPRDEVVETKRVAVGDPCPRVVRGMKFPDSISVRDSAPTRDV